MLLLMEPILTEDLQQLMEVQLQMGPQQMEHSQVGELAPTLNMLSRRHLELVV